MNTQQIMSLNGQIVNSIYQRALRMPVLYHSSCDFIFNKSTHQNVKQTKKNCKIKSSSKGSRLFKEIRWYAGFHCHGNDQEVLENIAQKVQESRLNNVIPLIHIIENNNNNNNHRSSKDFYLFVAIEIKKPGEFPNELSCLS